MFTHGPWGEFLYHRGMTHALWFGPVVGPLLGYAVWRGYARRRARTPDAAPTNAESDGAELDPGAPAARARWLWLWVLALLSHPLLDVCTPYGTQLLAPFSNHRFAFNCVPVIDPVYTGVLFLGAVLCWQRWITPRGKLRAAILALALSTAYVGTGGMLNRRAETLAREALAARGVTEARVRAYPTLFQILLRHLVARGPDRVWVGARTFLNPQPIAWKSFTPVDHPLVETLRRTREGRIFTWFAMGEVAARVIEEPGGFLVELDDLRYTSFGPPDRGIWGVRGRFDATGRRRGPVQKFNHRGMEPREQPFHRLWRALWGEEAP